MKSSKRPTGDWGHSAKVASSQGDIHRSLANARKETLWISLEKRLTEALVRELSWPVSRIGDALLLHAAEPQTLPTLANCFRRVAFSINGGFLPLEELAEALAAENRADLVIGGDVDRANGVVTLWRGNLESITVPFSAFEPSGDGAAPDFKRFSVTDCGQTIRLGDYEAATDAILYEFDPEYRRRIHKQRQASEQSFGASLRRLRKQRGLSREDFGPIAAKTVARIEQGKVQKIQKKTLEAIAHRLKVKVEEIAAY